jgi:CrcB protein
MTAFELLLVGIGGFLGAISRYLISEKFNRKKTIPKGTLLVNLLGSFLIGIVFGMELPRTWTLILASGFAGALTTFSTLNKEIILLWKMERKSFAIGYIVITFTVGILLAWVGYQMGSSL